MHRNAGTGAPAAVIRAAQRLAHADASGASAFDDFAVGGWDTYRMARLRFLTGLRAGESLPVSTARPGLALREADGG